MEEFTRIGKCAGLQWLIVGYMLAPIIIIAMEKIYNYKYSVTQKNNKLE